MNILKENRFFHNTSTGFSYYLNLIEKNKTFKPERAAKTQRHITKKTTYHLTPLPLRFHFFAHPLWHFLRFFIDLKSNTAAETEQHIKRKPLLIFWFYSCVWMSLRLLFSSGASFFLSGYPHFNIYSRKGTGSGEGANLMILTFIVNDTFADTTANNIIITTPCPCTLRLTANTRYFIIKKGPQNTQKDTEVQRRIQGVFIFFHYIFFLCILCVLWALYDLGGLSYFRR